MKDDHATDEISGIVVVMVLSAPSPSSRFTFGIVPSSANRTTSEHGVPSRPIMIARRFAGLPLKRSRKPIRPLENGSRRREALASRLRETYGLDVAQFFESLADELVLVVVARRGGD